MNFFIILVQLIFLYTFYTPIQGQELVWEFASVSIPPLNDFQGVKLWKRPNSDFYFFTNTVFLGLGHEIINNYPCFHDFQIINIYSMLAYKIWLSTNLTEQSIIVTCTSLESAQQFYSRFNPYPPNHINRFQLTGLNIGEPFIENDVIFITDNAAIDIYIIEDRNGQQFLPRQIVIHNYDNPKLPYMIFYSSEFKIVSIMEGSPIAIFEVKPENCDRPHNIGVSFKNIDDLTEFIFVHNRMPVLPQVNMRVMRALPPAGALNGSPASSVGDYSPGPPSQ